MTVSPTLTAALAYADAGLPVLPCKADTKAPHTRHGVKDATTDPKTIGLWWRNIPTAMIGLAMGGDHGLFVIDLDVKPGGPTADQLLTDVTEACGGVLPDTLIAVTRSGGYHLYFRAPGGLTIGNRAGVIPCVDVRGDGGYVVAPPSVTAAGEAYRWFGSPNRTLSDSEAQDLDQQESKGQPPHPNSLPPGEREQFELSAIAEATPEIIEFVTKRHDEPPSNRSSEASARRAGTAGDAQAARLKNDAVRRYADKAMSDEIAAVAETTSGGRNNRLNDAAVKLGSLVAAGALSETVVRAALEDAAERCGLIKDDGRPAAQKTIQSGLTFGKSKPRDLADIAARAGGPSAKPPPATGADYGTPPGASRDPRTPETNGSLPPSAASARRAGTAGDAQGGGQQGSSGGGGDAGGPPDDGDGGDDEPDPIDWKLVRRCAEEPQTDIGNGRRFLARFGHNCLWITNVGPHVWDGARWAKDETGSKVRPLAHKTAEAIHLEAVVLESTEAEAERIEAGEAALIELKSFAGRSDLTSEDKIKVETLKAAIAEGRMARKALSDRKSARRKYANSSSNSSKLDNMLKEASVYRSCDIEQFDADPYAINVGNGTLRFFNRGSKEKPAWDVRLDPHDRGDFNTKLCDVDYDPDATCPEFLNFLEEVHPDRAMPGEPPGDVDRSAVRQFLQTYHGYALTGLTREQVLVFHWGDGSNGKSTLIDIICRLMGDYAATVPIESLVGDARRRGSDATPELARLPGARLVRSSEPEKGSKLREGTVKSLTSSEPILVRHLNEGFIEIYPDFKLAVSGNDKPLISGTDHGIWRRLLLVPWLRKFEESEVDLAVSERLWAERSGILNWLIAGTLTYLQEGLTVPDDIRAAVKEYREESDPVGAFIAEACDVTGNDTDEETTGALYEAYQRFCKRSGMYELKPATFARQMPAKATQLGFKKGKSSRSKYSGIRIRYEYTYDGHGEGGTGG